ncbi:MAG: ABC transporter ATP-binding protein [Bacteroidales bacterium]|nr:ABC transporter ATP-binding protein [Bacteroidales bacterium]
MSDQNYIIELDHIFKSFGGTSVLEDVNLKIKKGEFVTFLGPSGCGKSTLLRIIAGFIDPKAGEIRINGCAMNEIPPHQRPVNMVFQRYALFPHLNVFDNIAFGLKLAKVPKAEIEQRVKKVLKMVSMSDYEYRDVNSLSGGQQQRVAIARAIVNRPQVLLLDEPLAALDLKMRKDMQIELKEMHDQLGITFIYVTHDQEEALTLSDTIVVMRDGIVQQIGTPTDIYNEPCNSFVADFIGESNILDATMVRDRCVSFIGHEFECVDEGFGENTLVDVVVRPEDVYIMAAPNKASQFEGTVRTCTFKGVHYEMFVDTDEGYEIMIQDYNAFEPGQKVGMYIKPNDIQVMNKDCICNEYEGVMTDDTHVKFLGGEFECFAQEGIGGGDKVKVKVECDAIDLMDDKHDGDVVGNVTFILYKGNHYHLTITTKESDDYVYADTHDIWDEFDQVGIKILPQNIKLELISKAE